MPVFSFARNQRSVMDSLSFQQEKKTVQEKNTKSETKPDVKPEITTVPKARKQTRPTVVKPVIVVKPIKVIKPKIKKP